MNKSSSSSFLSRLQRCKVDLLYKIVQRLLLKDQKTDIHLESTKAAILYTFLGTSPIECNWTFFWVDMHGIVLLDSQRAL